MNERDFFFHFLHVIHGVSDLNAELWEKKSVCACLLKNETSEYLKNSIE